MFEFLIRLRVAEVVLYTRYFLFSWLIDQILFLLVNSICLQSCIGLRSQSGLLWHTLLIALLERGWLNHALSIENLIVCLLCLCCWFSTKKHPCIWINFFATRIFTIIPKLLLVVKHCTLWFRLLDLWLRLFRLSYKLLSWVLRRDHGSLWYWSFLLYWWRNLLRNLRLLGKLIKEIRGRNCWTSHIISSLCFCLRFLIKLLEELLTWCLLSCTFSKITTGILGLTASILLICFAWKQRLSIHCWLSLRLCLGYRFSFNWSLLEIVEHIIVFFLFWLNFWIYNFLKLLWLLMLLLVMDFFLILLCLQIKILWLRWILSLKVRLELIVAAVIIE